MNTIETVESMNNHEHKYECTDVPAYYACSCGKFRVYDRLTKEYKEIA